MEDLNKIVPVTFTTVEQKEISSMLSQMLDKKAEFDYIYSNSDDLSEPENWDTVIELIGIESEILGILGEIERIRK